MFLQKALISLALGSIATSGVIQATNNAQTGSSINHPIFQGAKAQVNYVNPFNPSSFDHSYANGSDYYAYYKGDVFSTTVSGSRYGYVMQLGKGSMPYLTASYNWAIKHGYWGNIAMIAYLIGQDDTPYSKGWVYYDRFNDDANSNEESQIAAAASFSKLNFYNFVENAIQNNQTVDFYCFSINRFPTNCAKVMIENHQTGAYITTAWYDI